MADAGDLRVVRIETVLRLEAPAAAAVGIRRDADVVQIRIATGSATMAASIAEELLTRLSEGSMRLQVDLAPEPVKAN